MTDKLREAAQAVLDRWDSLDWKAAPTADYMNRLRDALAAAPQPAPVDREALVEVIQEVRRMFLPLYAIGATTGTLDGYMADALLARGLRLPGVEETMAWAVVRRDEPFDADYVYASRPYANVSAGERVVRVAIRVVEGGDDAA